MDVGGNPGWRGVSPFWSPSSLLHNYYVSRFDLLYHLIARGARRLSDGARYGLNRLEQVVLFAVLFPDPT